MDMEAVGALLGMAIICCTVVGSFWLLVEAFKQSRTWGWCCLLIPFANLVFVVRHWKVAKKPFGLYMLGLLAWLLVAMLSND